jgi:biopolymer transport protein ExbD
MSKDKYVFLRADKAVPYGELMGVMEILRSGGYSRIKLVALEAPPAAAGPAQGAAQP